MLLGGVGEQPQAQLDGFKSRVLRSGTTAQRHLYTTTWSEANGVVGGHSLIVLCESSSAQCEQPPCQPNATTRGAEVVIAASLATQHAASTQRPLSVLEIVLTLVQMQVASSPSLFICVLATATHGHAQHAGPWGLARSARSEATARVQCIDTAAITALANSPAEPEAVMRLDTALVPRLAHAPHCTLAAARAPPR